MFDGLSRTTRPSWQKGTYVRWRSNISVWPYNQWYRVAMTGDHTFPEIVTTQTLEYGMPTLGNHLLLRQRIRLLVIFTDRLFKARPTLLGRTLLLRWAVAWIVIYKSWNTGVMSSSRCTALAMSVTWLLGNIESSVVVFFFACWGFGTQRYRWDKLFG